MHLGNVRGRSQRVLMAGGSVLALSLGAASPAAAQDNGTAPTTQAQVQADAKAVAQADDGAADVVVTGRRAAEEAALQLKRSSLSVSETIVADDVGKLPDQNVAESVRRLPGLSVANDQGEGRYVIIRGVNPALVNVTVNGQTQPAPEPDGRQVKLDDIPSSLIAAVTVSKSITPDQDANAIGGAVDIRTLSAFDRKERLFFIARGQYGRYDLGGAHPYEGDAQVGGRFGANHQFGAVLSASYSSRPIESEQYEGSTNFAAGDRPDQFAFRDYHLTRKRTGFVGNFDWQPTDAVKLYLRSTYSRFSDSETRDRQRITNLAYSATTPGAFTGRGVVLVRAREENSNTKSVSGGGSFRLGESHLDIAGAYARATKKDPFRSEYQFRTASTSAISGTADLTQNPYALTFTPFDPANIRFQSVNYDNRLAVEDLWQVRADYTVPVAIGDDSTIKIGAKYLNRHKTNDRSFEQFGAGTNPGFALSNVSFFGNTEIFDGRYAFGPRIDYDAAQAYIAANPGVRTQSASDRTAGIGNSLVNDYDVREKITAGYAMAIFRFGGLTVIPGVRVEHTKDAAAAKLITASSTLTQGYNSFGAKSYTDIFPGLNVKFVATDNLIFRAAATTSLGRPNYPDLAPFVSVDTTTATPTVTQGNADIEPYKAWNLDATAEYYLGKDGVLSIGLFYKHIDNPIYTRTTPVLGGTFAGQAFATANVVQPLNADQAIIKGVEFNAQYQFTFLPGVLGGLGASANYTIVGGEGSGLPGRAGDFPLFFQSKRIGSGQLTYEKYGVTGRVAYSFRSRYLDLLGTSALTDQYTGHNGQVDARIGLGVTGNVEVYVEGINLNDAHFRQFLGTKNRIVLDERYGQAFRVGAQVKF